MMLVECPAAGVVARKRNGRERRVLRIGRDDLGAFVDYRDHRGEHRIRAKSWLIWARGYLDGMPAEIVSHVVD